MPVTKQEFERLKNVKQALESVRKKLKEAKWAKITRFCLPELDNPDDKRLDHRPRYSSAAVRYTNLASDALQGWAYGSSISWLRLALEDIADDEVSDDAKQWLQDCEELITNDLRRSQFYDAATPFTHSAFNLGTGIMLIDFDDENNIFIFQTQNPWNCVVAQNKYGDIDCLMTDFWLDKDGAQEHFGEENLPQKIRNAKDYTEQFKFCRAIVSSKRYDLSVPGDGEWIEVIWPADDEGKTLSERRLTYKPFAVWRYATSLDSTAWGTGAPGEAMLTTIENLNAMEKSSLKGLQLREEPPVKATEGLAVNITPNGITYLSGSQDFQYAPPSGSPSETLEKIAKKEQDLKEAYYVDFFLMLQQTLENQKTATEASLLSDEKSQIMSSFASRLGREFLEPVIEAVFELEKRYQRLPKPPVDISDSDIKVDYVSPLAVAQKKAQEYAPARQFIVEAMSFAQLDPNIVKKIKLGPFVDAMADVLNVKRDFILPEEEYQAYVDAQEKKAQEMLNNEDRRAQSDSDSKAYAALSKAPEAGSPAEALRLGTGQTQGYAILVREEFSCLEFIMNRDTINWILKKLNTGGRIWSIYQRKSIKTASATRWWETTTSPIWSCRRKAAPLGGGAGCTRRFCKNTGPASTMHCFCRKNSGHILLT